MHSGGEKAQGKHAHPKPHLYRFGPCHLREILSRRLAQNRGQTNQDQQCSTITCTIRATEPKAKRRPTNDQASIFCNKPIDADVTRMRTEMTPPGLLVNNGVWERGFCNQQVLVVFLFPQGSHARVLAVVALYWWKRWRGSSKRETKYG